MVNNMDINGTHLGIRQFRHYTRILCTLLASGKFLRQTLGGISQGAAKSDTFSAMLQLLTTVHLPMLAAEKRFCETLMQTI